MFSFKRTEYCVNIIVIINHWSYYHRWRFYTSTICISRLTYTNRILLRTINLLYFLYWYCLFEVFLEREPRIKIESSKPLICSIIFDKGSNWQSSMERNSYIQTKPYWELFFWHIFNKTNLCKSFLKSEQYTQTELLWESFFWIKIFNLVNQCKLF